MAKQISWGSLVADADPELAERTRNPVVYEFSNGAKFRERQAPPEQTYPWAEDIEES